jgi:hypothetical protein
MTKNKTITACDSYTWPANGEIYTVSGSYIDTLTNTAGCDSIMTLNLTVNRSTTSSESITACDSYTWPANGLTYTVSGLYIDTLTNVAGCDSVVTLDLIINSVSDNTTSVSYMTITANNTKATYQWLDCDNNYAKIVGETGRNFIATANGNYAVELIENGCIDTSSCVSITTVGVIETNFDQMFKVFPNPSEGEFTIDLGNEYKSAVITIRNANSRIVYSSSNISKSTIQLALDEPAGVYFIEIASSDKIAILKLIKL